MDRLDKTTRRMVMRTGLGLVAGTAALATAAQAAPQRVAQSKIAQNLVQYQDGPKDGLECDKCVNWQPPDACTIVEGKINPKGWCVAYAPKEG